MVLRVNCYCEKGEINVSRDWHKVKQQIENAIDLVWLEEPLEVQRIRLGIIEGGAGTGGQYFTNLVFLQTYTLMLGQRILYSLMLVAKKPQTNLEMVRMFTRALMSDSFHPTEFLADLGLHSMHELGTAYLEALDDLQTKEEFMELTGVFMTYATRMHRWIHFIFPWNIGVLFPQSTTEEYQEIAKMLSTDEKGEDFHNASRNA